VVAEAQRRVGELLFLVVVPQHEAAVAVPACRLRAQVRIGDRDVGVALVVEADDVAAIVEHVEPAKQRLAQAGMRDRRALVPERAGAVELEPDLSHALELLGRELHPSTILLAAVIARGMRLAVLLALTSTAYAGPPPG